MELVLSAIISESIALKLFTCLDWAKHPLPQDLLKAADSEEQQHGDDQATANIRILTTQHADSEQLNDVQVLALYRVQVQNSGSKSYQETHELGGLPRLEDRDVEKACLTAAKANVRALRAILAGDEDMSGARALRLARIQVRGRAAELLRREVDFGNADLDDMVAKENLEEVRELLAQLRLRDADLNTRILRLEHPF